jgi:hypothetical protein
VEDVAGARGRSRAAGLLSGWLPLLAYAGLIFYLSSRTGGGLPRWWFMRYDKVLHAGEYFWLAVLLYRALRSVGMRVRSAVIGAIAASILFGASDEFHQSFVAGRQGNDLGDLTADTVGATLGSLTAAWAGRVITRKRRAA